MWRTRFEFDVGDDDDDDDDDGLSIDVVADEAIFTFELPVYLFCMLIW